LAKAVVGCGRSSKDCDTSGKKGKVTVKVAVKKSHF